MLLDFNFVCRPCFFPNFLLFPAFETQKSNPEVQEPKKVTVTMTDPQNKHQYTRVLLLVHRDLTNLDKLRDPTSLNISLNKVYARFEHLGQSFYCFSCESSPKNFKQ